MSTLQNSIEWLDESLDIGFKELNTFLDNNVYSVRRDIEETIFGYINGALNTLRTITGKIRDTINAILAIPQKIINEMQKIIDKFLNELLNFNFSGWIGRIVYELKRTNLRGTREYLLSATAAGSTVLCANLDVIQDMTTGYLLPEHILEGLMIGLSIDWMNRICKDVTRSEELFMTNSELLESVYPYLGLDINPGDVVFYFTGVLSSFLNIDHDPWKLKAPLKDKDFFKVNLEGKRSIFEIQKEMGELSSFEEKEEYLKILNEINEEFFLKRKANNVVEISREEMRALELRGEIARTEVVDREKLAEINNVNNVKDTLGSLIKNLKDINLDEVPVHKLNDKEKSILLKIRVIQNLSKDVEFLSRKHGKDQFQDIDFNSIIELFTEDEIEYIKSCPKLDIASRYNGLHPTTESFLSDEVYHPPKNNFNAVGI